ncbi:MAG: hypothetical protein ACUVT6_12435 [Thermodesulfobacteriota bacterium]
MIKKIIGILVIMIVVSGYSLAGNKAAITISANVLPRLSQTLLYQRAYIYISGGDIEKGYTEIPSGTILQVSTNWRRGYALFFECGYELIKEIWVMTKGRTTILSHNGGFVYQPFSGRDIEIKDISYKLFLRENIKPGFYPFPIKVRASLL